MRKSITILLTILLIFTLTGCQSDEPKGYELEKKGELAVRMDIKPLQPYGNQLASINGGFEYFFKEADEIYFADYDRIVKFSLDDPKNQKTVADFEDSLGSPNSISVMGDWIFFISEDSLPPDYEFTQNYLYRMKKDGSEKERLAGRVESYILTEKEIYYKTYNGGIAVNEDDNQDADVRVMSLDGKKERELLDAGDLAGIDNGWVYYARNSLHRMKPDGTKREKVLEYDVNSINAVDYCLVENDQIYFVRNDKTDEGKSYLMKKTINGEETILDTGTDFQLTDTSSLNKRGNWLYYGERDKVYRINVNGTGERQLVYRFEGKDFDGESYCVNCISISDDGVFIDAFDKIVYVKDDGTVIDL